MNQLILIYHYNELADRTCESIPMSRMHAKGAVENNMKVQIPVKDWAYRRKTNHYCLGFLPFAPRDVQMHYPGIVEGNMFVYNSSEIRNKLIAIPDLLAKNIH